MIEPLEKALADIRRFPEARQRDAADCILRTLRMDAKTEVYIYQAPNYGNASASKSVSSLPRHPFTEAPSS